MPKKESLFSLKMLLFSFQAANTIVISFLPVFLTYRGLSAGEVGWVLAVGPLASIIAQPFWGYMSDKYKTIRRMLILCAFGLIVSSSIFFNVTALTLIMVFAFVFFFFTTPIGGLSDSLAQQKSEELGLNFGSIRTWGSIGFAASALVVGQILNGRIQYTLWPFLVLGLLVLFFSFKVNDVKVTSVPIALKDAFTLLKNKRFIMFLIFLMFITISHRTNDSFIAIYLQDTLHASESVIGMAWFVGLGSEALVMALSKFWYKKFSPLTFLIIAGAIYAARWFSYSFVTEAWIIVILQVLNGVTFALFYLASFDLTSELVPKPLHTSGHLAFYTVYFGISGIIGSLMGGKIMESFGGHTLYVVMGVFALAGTIFLILYNFFSYAKTRNIQEESAP